MNLPTINVDEIESAEQSAKQSDVRPVLSEGDMVMQMQRAARNRLVPFQSNHGMPIVVHRGDRPSGKAIRAARAAERKARAKMKLTGSEEIAAVMVHPVKPEFDPIPTARFQGIQGGLTGTFVEANE